ncbi:MAG: SRPBCC family protein [Bacteroidales bacterium]|nr:MAG: SRPBCC family protein [Bacteroidales bacterium]
MKILKYILFPIAILVILFFSLGLLFPKVEYESKVIVDRPVDKSFMVFLDVRKMSQWLTGFKSIELISGMPNMPGSRFLLTMEVNGREVTATEEVTGFRWNEMFAFTLENDIMTVSSEIRFVRQEMKTEITGKNTVHGKNLFWKSLNVLLRNSMSRQSQEDYTKLKKVIEAS